MEVSESPSLTQPSLSKLPFPDSVNRAALTSPFQKFPVSRPAILRLVSHMADIFTPEKRSEVMSKIRGKNTKPEIAVRSMLHRLGYRFTVNGSKNKKLPGRPDIVLPRHNTLIFVHGCFWHGHEGCRDFRLPKSRTEFWTKKIHGNISRDFRNEATLRRLGWKALTIWACEMKTLQAKANLCARLPALIELEPVTYAFRNDESPPIAAEHAVEYVVKKPSET